jgi:hypothetical protein
MFIRECSSTHMQGRGRKKNWAKGEVSCNVLLTKASVDSVGTSGGKMSFQNCLKLGQEGQASLLSKHLVWPSWVECCPSGETVPKRIDNWGYLLGLLLVMHNSVLNEESSWHVTESSTWSDKLFGKTAGTLPRLQIPGLGLFLFPFSLLSVVSSIFHPIVKKKF